MNLGTASWKQHIEAILPHLSNRPQSAAELAVSSGVQLQRASIALSQAAEIRLVVIARYRQTTRLVPLYVRVGR